MYVGNLLIKMYYPNVVTFFIKKVGAKEARERLYQVGQEVGRELMKLFKPKTLDVKTMIYKFYKLMWNTTKNVKVKKLKEKDRILYQVIDKKCGICDPETAIEGLEVSCVIIDGYLDACLEHINKLAPFPSYQIRTVKSVAAGDKYCEHLIEIAW